MPRRRDPEATRRRILAAAERSFAEKGFAGTASSDVADGAGVTKSLIHHHFGSMRALWETVQAAAQLGLRDVDAPLLVDAWHSADEVADALSASVMSLVEHHEQHPRAARLRSWREMLGEGTALRLSANALEQLETAQDQGFLRADVDAGNVIHGLFSTLDTWFRRAGDARPPTGCDRTFVEDVMIVTISGILPTHTPGAHAG